MSKSLKRIFQKIKNFLFFLFVKGALSFFPSFIFLLFFSFSFSLPYFFSFKKEIDKAFIPSQKKDGFEEQLKEIIQIVREEKEKSAQEIFIPLSPFRSLEK